MNNDIKEKICQDDFYVMMRNAVLEAGGGDDLEKWKNMTLVQLVNILAQNGIRIVYIPEKHMDSVKIVWESTKSNTKPTSPKKKQLLCDIMSKSDDDYEWTKDDMGG